MSGANVHTWSVNNKQDIHLKFKAHVNSYQKVWFFLPLSVFYEDHNKKYILTKLE